jgi:hypothetical protein
MTVASATRNRQKGAGLVGHHLWIIIWVATLLSLYEVEMRSTGMAELLPPIPILPGFWLSDFGLLLPILFAGISGGMLYFLRIRIVAYFLLTCCYGMILFFVHNNSFIALGMDLRTCTALLTGLSLVYIVPSDGQKVVTALNIISLSAVIITIYHLLNIPEFDVGLGERVTTDAANTLTALPLVLISPLIIIFSLVKNRRNMLIAWSTMFLFFTLSGVIMKTRSTFFALFIALFLSMIPLLYLSGNMRSPKTIKTVAAMTMVAALFFVAVFLNQGINIEEFIARLAGTGDDFTSLWRKLEVWMVLETMTMRDLIIGMGFNPPSPLFTVMEGGWAVEGVNYNSLHIGILNVWWRFGLVVFVVWLLMFFKLFLNWVKSLNRLKSRSSNVRFPNQYLGVAVCAPGVFVLVSLSLMSGGWSVHSFLALGILLGLYVKIKRGKIHQAMG